MSVDRGSGAGAGAGVPHTQLQTSPHSLSETIKLGRYHLGRGCLGLGLRPVPDSEFVEFVK